MYNPHPNIPPLCLCRHNGHNPNRALSWWEHL